jgi:hypothetical protein
VYRSFVRPARPGFAGIALLVRGEKPVPAAELSLRELAERSNVSNATQRGCLGARGMPDGRPGRARKVA